MTLGPVYKGQPTRQRTDYGPKIPTAVKKDRAVASKTKNLEFTARCQDLHKRFQDEINNLATQYGHSPAFVATSVGLGGIERTRRRGPNARNGWIKSEMAQLNDGVPKTEKTSLTDFLAEHGDEWTDKTPEEQAFYRDLITKARDDKAFATTSSDVQETVRKLGQRASADVRTVLKNIMDSIQTLPERTGYAISVIGCKIHYSCPSPPVVFIPPALNGFTECILGKTAPGLAFQMEGYALAGGEGVAKAIELKREGARGLLVKRLNGLFTTIVRGQHRINYSEWDEKTSLRFSITLEGWPQDVPKAPKSLTISQCHQLLQDIDDKKVFYRAMLPEEIDLLRAKVTSKKKAAGAGSRKRKRAKGKVVRGDDEDTSSEEEVED